MITQIDLPKSLRSPLRWGSHIPTCLAVLDTFPITGVLELGVGTNSTPLFFSKTSIATSIEADLEWIRKLRHSNLVVEDIKHKIIHHPLDAKYTRTTRREELDHEILQKATNFYRSHFTPEMNLLFVDCFAGFRLQALIDLHGDFDVSLYHDAETKADKWYSYSQFVPKSNYINLIDQTFLANTGIVLNKKYKHLLSDFEANLHTRAAEYAARFDVFAPVNLEKIA